MSITPASRPVVPAVPVVVVRQAAGTDRTASARRRGLRTLLGRIGEAARAAHTESVPF